MNALLNKKGLEIAIGTVAILAIVLIVIVVVVGFFLGGFGRTGGGIGEIGQQGEKGAGELELQFQCLGTSRMTDDSCERFMGTTESVTLCSVADGKTTGKKCSDITDKEECNDLTRARGCYWGFAQT